jgi:16S rRNA (uracil1498-N3)-methyltransferase
VNRLLLTEAECTASSKNLLMLDKDDRRSRHILDVLRLAPGAVLQAALLNRGLTTLTFLEARAESLYFQIAPLQMMKNTAAIDLILALPRPQTLRKILFLAPQMGIRRIALMRSRRVEKSFYHSPLLSTGEWRRHLQLGMEQAGTCFQPEVEIHERFLPFVEDHLPTWLAPGSIALIPHPKASGTLSDLPLPLAPRSCLAIGPEGGWQAHEVLKFQEMGFVPIHLGERIMRVETAVCACAAQLDLLVSMTIKKEPQA